MTRLDDLARATRESVAPIDTVLAERAAVLEHEISFDVWHQEMDYWCWDAVSTAISNFLEAKQAWSQCDFATAFLNIECCPTAGPCDKPQSLGDALTSLGHLRERVDVAATPPQISEEVDQDRPVGARIEWTDGSGHFVAIGGYLVSDGEMLVTVEDPWTGSHQVALLLLMNGYRGSRAWTHSYFVK